MNGGIKQILEHGKAPGTKKSSSAWRGYVSRIHDGDMQGASQFYADNTDSVNQTKPKIFDIVREN
jgi:hypothetical protein